MKILIAILCLKIVLNKDEFFTPEQTNEIKTKLDKKTQDFSLGGTWDSEKGSFVITIIDDSPP